MGGHSGSNRLAVKAKRTVSKKFTGMRRLTKTSKAKDHRSHFGSFCGEAALENHSCLLRDAHLCADLHLCAPISQSSHLCPIQLHTLCHACMLQVFMLQNTRIGIHSHNATSLWISHFVQENLERHTYRYMHIVRWRLRALVVVSALAKGSQTDPEITCFV